MAFRLNQGGEEVWAGAEAGKKEEHKPVEAVFRANGKGPWFQEKTGSVFPGKKKKVTTMMFERLEASSHKMAGSSKISSTTPSKSFKGKKSVGIFPET